MLIFRGKSFYVENICLDSDGEVSTDLMVLHGYKSKAEAEEFAKEIKENFKAEGVDIKKSTDGHYIFFRVKGDLLESELEDY